MASDMRRTAAISAGLHLMVLLAFLVVIPDALPPPAPPDDAMEVDFAGTAASAQKSDRSGHVAAPTEADTPATDMPAEKIPTKQPIEKPPPPPPPPPAPPPPPPAQTQALAAARLLPPPPLERAETIKPPPPVKLAAPTPPQPVAAPIPPKPLKDPQRTKPLDTVRHQQNETKNPAPDTKSLMNTLDKLMADQKQDKAPTHTYNPSRGGAHDAGGQKHGNLTGSLSEGQRKTIGDSVRRCYAEDTAAKDYASYRTIMTVTLDASGEAHDAKLSPGDQGRAGRDPAFRAFAERAMAAVLDPQCAKLPLPAALLGKDGQTLTFGFSP